MAEIKKLLDDAIETEINNLNSTSDTDEKSEVTSRRCMSPLRRMSSPRSMLRASIRRNKHCGDAG